MSDQTRRDTVLVWKENLQKIQFRIFSFDPGISAMPACSELWKKVSREYYFYKQTPSLSFYSWKRYRFEKLYRKNPSLFPVLILPETLSLDKMTSAVPGTPLDKNFFIGYFRDLKLSDGRYPPDLYGLEAKPWLPALEGLAYRLENLSTGIRLSGGEADIRLKSLEDHLNDLKTLCSVFRFAAEIFTYAQTEALPQLKTGHVIGLAGGLYSYLRKLEQNLSESGFLLADTDPGEVSVKLLNDLQDSLRQVLPFWAADLISPAVTAVGARLENSGSQVVFIPPQRPRHKGLLEKLLDALLPPMPQENGTMTAPAAAVRPAQPVSFKAAPRNTVQPGDRLIESMPFYNLSQELKKWNERLRNELEDVKNPQGKVIQARQGFDQFDIPERERDPGTGRAVLSGKASSGEGASYRNSDALVVKSVYWLYDRVKGVTDNYRVRKDGITLDTAIHFVDDARTLFSASKTEYNEIRAMGTFSQFQTNIRRILSSGGQIGRLNNQIHYMEEMMKTVETHLKEQQARLEKPEEKPAPNLQGPAGNQ